MIPRGHLPIIQSGKMCKNLAHLQPKPCSFVGPKSADGPANEVAIVKDTSQDGGRACVMATIQHEEMYIVRKCINMQLRPRSH